MNDPMIIAGAVVLVLTQLTTMICTVIAAIVSSRKLQQNQEATNRNGMKADLVGAKADALLLQTKEIHTLTNSTNSNLQKALDVAQETNKGLERLVLQLHQQMTDQAATLVASDRMLAAALAAPSPTQLPRAGVLVDPGLDRRAPDPIAPSETLKRVDKTTQATLAAVTHEQK